MRMSENLVVVVLDVVGVVVWSAELATVSAANGSRNSSSLVVAPMGEGVAAVVTALLIQNAIFQ